MWPNPQETADLVTFTEEIFNGKIHILSSETIESRYLYWPDKNHYYSCKLKDFC